QAEVQVDKPTDEPVVKLMLPTLNDTKMVLELADRTISKPTGWLRMFSSKSDQQSLTIQCCDIPSVKKIEQINKIKFINAEGIDFESEEIEDFLNDDSIQIGVEDSPFNMDKDILFLKSLLRDELIPPHPIIPNQTKLSIEEINHSLKMGYEHFKTNLLTKDVAESSTKNLIPIPNECIIVSDNGSQSTEPINDDSSNPLSDEPIVKNDYFDEFYGPFIPIHILEEERTKRDHADYIKRMEMLFTINPRPHNPTNDNTNVESFSSFQILNQESEPRQEKIDVVSETNDVLPPSNDDSDDEVDVDGDLHFECIDARIKFDVENDVFKFIMFSLLSAESEDTIFDPGILRTTEYRDRVEPTTRIISRRLKISCDYLSKIEDFLCRILSWFSRPSYPLINLRLGKFISVIYIAYWLIVSPLRSKF
nr:hypothetical protein [Tanacetum cinerariifolium]